jgi:hypothetical protein
MKSCDFCNFHPSLIFAGKAGAYLSEAPYSLFHSKACKYKTRVEVTIRDEHSSFNYRINYDRKKFCCTSN